MKLHANAQTCPHCRSLMVSRVMGGHPAISVARDFQVSTKTVHKWIARFRAQGRAGLDDRSSRPHHITRRHLQPGNELNDAVFALLHTPPRDSGFNRTTWRLADLHSALKTRGVIESSLKACTPHRASRARSNWSATQTRFGWESGHRPLAATCLMRPHQRLSAVVSSACWIIIAVAPRFISLSK
jgi:transposase